MNNTKKIRFPIRSPKPDPVTAEAHISLPASTSGIVCACIGDGLSQASSMRGEGKRRKRKRKKKVNNLFH